MSAKKPNSIKKGNNMSAKKPNIERPFIANKTFDRIFIYPEKNENFQAFEIKFPYIKKSEISEEQFKSEKVKRFLLSKMIEEMTEEELKSFLDKMENRVPNNSSKDFKADDPKSCAGLTESLDTASIANNRTIDRISSEDVKHFQNKYFKDLEKSVNEIDQRYNEKYKPARPTIKIMDILIKSAEDKLNEMVEDAVSKTKLEFKTKIDELVEQTFVFDDIIDKIKLSVKEPKIVKPEPIIDKEGTIIGGKDKVVIKDEKRIATAERVDPSGCWPKEDADLNKLHD